MDKIAFRHAVIAALIAASIFALMLLSNFLLTELRWSIPYAMSPLFVTGPIYLGFAIYFLSKAHR